ncbi:hypothetical protein BH23GEM6_BH23GEM6_07070 [soil metagenome]
MTRGISAMTVLILLVGCGDGPTDPPSQAVCTAAPANVGMPAFQREQMIPLDRIFAAAGAEFGVPAELLKAIGYVETRWEMVEGHPEFGQPAAYGVMALRQDVIARAAGLAGVSEAEARLLPAANIRAAAALLRDHADAVGVDRSNLAAWAETVGWYSGITLPAGRSSYVHDDVYARLRAGVHVPGIARLEPVAASPLFPNLSTSTSTSSSDYTTAVWRPSPNFNSRPATDIGRIAMIIIHSCEGGYTGCWSWLANPVSGVSAHYVVKEDGSEISQLVTEASRGWHIGSTYNCQLNNGVDCWRNGFSNNHFTIGVEHGGYASQSSWPRAQIEASARLVCDVTRRQGITRDNIRIVSHAQLQPHNRTDPGANWPWSTYLELINLHCGGSWTATELIIDSDNSANNRERGYLSVSTAWSSSSATPGYWGAGYQVAPTGNMDDPAVFHFYLPDPAAKQIDVRWTAETDRSPTARYTVMAGGESLASFPVNQQRDGGDWRTLGSWNFPAGWNSVRLSREGPIGCVVVADAVRVR